MRYIDFKYPRFIVRLRNKYYLCNSNELNKELIRNILITRLSPNYWFTICENIKDQT